MYFTWTFIILKFYNNGMPKEILAELYDIQISEVDDLILQKIVDFKLTGMEFRLYAASRACIHNDCYF